MVGPASAPPTHLPRGEAGREQEGRLPGPWVGCDLGQMFRVSTFASSSANKSNDDSRMVAGLPAAGTALSVGHSAVACPQQPHSGPIIQVRKLRHRAGTFTRPHSQEGPGPGSTEEVWL